MKYNILEDNCFYIKKGNYKISYAELYSYLKGMKNNGKEEMTLNLGDEKKSETFKLILLKNDSQNSYVIQIDNGIGTTINKKKSLCFYNEEKNLINKINIYNKDQIYQYYDSLIKKYKNINCYDSKENIIEFTDFDLFNKISYFQQFSDLKKKNEFNNIDYYKKIFDSYYNQTFENKGQEISFNLLEYSGQDPKTFEYHDTEKRFNIIKKLSLFI